MKTRFFQWAMLIAAAACFTMTSCDKDDDNNKSTEQDDTDFVDLGLPSGTLWAKCNVGASSPEKFGDHFAWGETEAKTAFRISNYKYQTEGSPESEFVPSKYTSADGLTELEVEDDAAAANLGSDWQMPTADQYKELVDAENTTCEYTTQNNVGGYLITSKTNSNSIFLPAAGFYTPGGLQSITGQYWTSTADDGVVAYIFAFDANAVPGVYSVGGTRFLGRSVRAVSVNKRK